ncbi:NifU family protein [Winogradskyella maritima]|uniref:NifU family protein n=1 Tax=Winogradskyella maritima TaxID=1517766 RepID=A0ABV8AH39_9FLAO|nr:NifU family protein [Winogradskyella maritima]
MDHFSINIIETSNPAILKFEANQFLTEHQSFEFNNIDEAKPSPLAQQLFYLPFVKKVYVASNFVAIERYDIVAWDDVKDEVASQIETYLNSGQTVVEATETKTKSAVTVYAESTPNPSVLKFVSNKALVSSIYEFSSIDETKDAPLAQELFKFPFVKAVFMDKNFISITKYDVAEWENITFTLREFLKSYIETQKPIITRPQQSEAQETKAEIKQPKKSLDPTSQQIVDILDEYVKPAVASDGGNIEFKSYDNTSKKVEVLLQGACSGCPSSTFTLKNGIESMLKEMLGDQAITVSAINT